MQQAGGHPPYVPPFITYGNGQFHHQQLMAQSAAAHFQQYGVPPQGMILSQGPPQPQPQGPPTGPPQGPPQGPQSAGPNLMLAAAVSAQQQQQQAPGGAVVAQQPPQSAAGASSAAAAAQQSQVVQPQSQPPVRLLFL